jgi:hypothetical protein
MLNVKRWYVKQLHVRKNPYADSIHTLISLKLNPPSTARQQFLKCTARTIRNLEEHRNHLESLEETLPILSNLAITIQCQIQYYQLLEGLEIHSIKSEKNCDCIIEEENRSNYISTDIVVIRIGQMAIDHVTHLGERYINEMARTNGVMEEDNLKTRYQELEKNLIATFNNLKHNDQFISEEFLTGKYQLKFSTLPNESQELAKPCGWEEEGEL